MSKLTIIQKLEQFKKILRPSVYDYIPLIFTDFTEFHGDRRFGDDPAIVGGIARLGPSADQRPVTIIAQARGRNIEEFQKTNNAQPQPEGYRKALRLAKQAEKFHRPVICFIDTPGAYPGTGAEERGQGEAIARNLLEFMTLRTPVISVVLGEGGSGGALALGVCDELALLENALYSVISPRGCASILWKDAGREKEAAEQLKITAEDLLAFGVCEHIIPESEGGAQTNVKETAANIAAYLHDALGRFAGRDPASLQETRYAKFRKIGVFLE
ncbi:MAG: acetyl-CoA carboxylase carboxyl transferase subunit alpha [Treponema sp.]|jgi:acetyl-CoA carboxylase carboxyl transferase subunit alpha|nr:acetyl-CoA carboxylase carboxyl transferase subunit alpha [Treponema sp.]